MLGTRQWVEPMIMHNGVYTTAQWGVCARLLVVKKNNEATKQQ